ncbi:MAG: recombinase family protein [Gemmataceae bacterium]|nr:recombinase family protein [Gemmataceae bacterium]
MTRPVRNGSEKKTIRCAIYTRKSTEEGLDQDFNSLDAQRESAEAFIKSQAHEGWTCLPDHYDDGGFTGGNMERPALRRLVADIEVGKIDCVVTYKVDRLSRSLLDFARMMDLFERKQVAFVSVTQQFCTTHSMGRLTLNILLSFAQFEREIISERTRDKIAAARRKGKWSGGMPVLGYDLDPDRSKLLVNEAEAEQVREIFRIYSESGGLVETVQELDRRGWVAKRWRTKKGKERGGKPFGKTTLQSLLRNVVYLGKVRHKAEVFRGEHAAIIPTALWRAVQARLKANRPVSDTKLQVKEESPLKGLIRCAVCDCAMTPAHSRRGTARRYRYYVCTQAQKRGWKTCPTKAIPALHLEDLVQQQIERFSESDRLAELLKRGREAIAERRRILEEEAAIAEARLQELADSALPDQDAIWSLKTRLDEIAGEARSLGEFEPDESTIRASLKYVASQWNACSGTERSRRMRQVLRTICCTKTEATLNWNESGIAKLSLDTIAETQEMAK